MTEKEHLDAIYHALHRETQQVRRSTMTMYNMIHVLETTEDSLGRLMTREIAWLPSDHLYMIIIRHNIRIKVFTGIGSVVYENRLSGIPMCGVCREVVSAVCDLVWARFAQNMDSYPLHDEDGSPITTESIEKQMMMEQEQQRQQQQEELVYREDTVTSNGVETAISLDHYEPPAVVVHKRATAVPPPLQPSAVLLSSPTPQPPLPSPVAVARSKGKKDE